jgi:hypothetical protein
MEIDILISQLDEHNEGSVLLTKKYMPKEVYFIIDNKKNQEMQGIRQYYQEKFSNIILKEFIINEGDSEQIEKVLTSISNKKMAVNLSGGPRVNSLILLDLCNKKNIDSLYIDIKNKVLYRFNEKILVIKEEFEDLNIDDILKTSGGVLLEDLSDLCLKGDLIYLSKEIYKNLDIWHKYKQRLYEAAVFQHDEQNNKRVYVNIDNLSDEEEILVKKILKKLKSISELNYKIENKKITIDFLNDYLKTFIFKSGTWLEIATNNIIKNIKEIDESKNGVSFLWNNENKFVRNEVDVVAVKNSIPICISCKDSDKYNEVALNELNVYAEKIGGDDVYKILVATKEPEKKPVRTRAEEMGINIVIFDGDEDKFINNIKKIIEK